MAMQDRDSTQARSLGWDISYHPVAADEIRSLYFDGLDDAQHADTLQRRFGINTAAHGRLQQCLHEARQIGASLPFHKGHAFLLAVVAGFVRGHHYIRGGAFSFLAEDAVMKRYIGDWRALIPAPLQFLEISNRLAGNCSGGAYLPLPSLRAIRRDYYRQPYVRHCMDEVFSQGRLVVFWQALDDAIRQGMGLLEASGVVQPNPFYLAASRSLADMDNCHPEGLRLYAQAAADQLGRALDANRHSLPLLGADWPSGPSVK